LNGDDWEKSDMEEFSPSTRIDCLPGWRMDPSARNATRSLFQLILANKRFSVHGFAQSVSNRRVVVGSDDRTGGARGDDMAVVGA
jgi:hypothetical protein